MQEGGQVQNTSQDIERLESEFKECEKLLRAIGDETRQHLICVMLEGDCAGDRVIDISERMNLSRPAVSHHMQILKDAGMVKARREGTCIYYYLDPDKEEMRKLANLLLDIQRVTGNAPEREGEEF